VKDVVQAILLALEKDASGGQVFNVVHPGRISKRTYVDGLVRRLYPSARVVYLPFSMVRLGVLLQEILLKALRRKPSLTCYRLVSSQMPVVIDASKITKELGWEPTVSFEDAVLEMLSGD